MSSGQYTAIKGMTVTKYIWQNHSLPKSLRRKEIKSQAFILGHAHFFDIKEEANILIEDAFTISEVEGEKLVHESIRSTLALRASQLN